MKRLHDWVGGDESTKEIIVILSRLIESQLYSSKLTKEREERHQGIWGANARIHELGKLLGEQRPVDRLSEQPERLDKIISDWWDEHGFHHISESNLIRSRIFITLVFSLGMF
ncbi:hypothetical protein D3C74_88180 [compost metagenome]